MESENNNHEEEHSSTGLNHKKLLMWTFLGSDCMFFAALIATYLVNMGNNPAGTPSPEDVFSIPITTVSTFVLLMSSMSMVLSYASLSQNRIKAFRVWLLSTVILGATFVGFQIFEFYEFANHQVKVECSDLLDDSKRERLTDLEIKIGNEKCIEGIKKVSEKVPLTPQVNLFGSTFFTLTGFHGGHVTFGIIWLLSLLIYSFRGNVSPLNLDLAALYWHFVDVVWIVIFTVVYLFGVFPGY